MKKLARLFAWAAFAAVAAGCSASSTGPPTATNVVSPALSTLQVVVGTANIFGGDPSSINQSIGMNVVTTLRTPQGKSVLVSTPTLTGPFTLPSSPVGIPDGFGSTVETGPAASEIAQGGIIGATPQVPPGTVQINPSSFGVSGGDFANGFMPSNADNVGTIQNLPYAQALFNQCVPSSSSCTPNPNSFTAWGGPPAFDPNHNGQGTRDGTFDPSIVGVAEGINVFFGTTVNPGTYTMSVLIPTINQNFTKTAATSVPTTVRTLGNALAPAFVPNGNGGGTFNVVMPTGATEALVQIEDIGPPGTSSNPVPLNCYKQGQPPAFFTIHVIGSGPATLPDNDGPGNPNLHSPTICTAAQNAAVGTTTGPDQILVQLIATDYPLYASQYLFTLSNPAPNIRGPFGTDDITISPLVGGTGARPRTLHRARAH